MKNNSYYMAKKPLNKKESKILPWIKEHVRPHIRWSKYDERYRHEEDASLSEIEKWEDKVKKQTVLGIKIKWRF